MTMAFLGYAQNPFLKNKADNIELQAFKRSIGNSIFLDKESVKPGDSFSVIVELQMIDEWYTYWETSGGIGMPMQFEVTPPEGIKLKSIDYPYPKYKFDSTIRSATYYNDKNVIYFLNFEVDKDAKTGELDLNFTVNWQACKVQCIQPFGELPKRTVTVKIADSTVENEAVKKIKEKGLEKIPVPIPDGWKVHGQLITKSYQGQFDNEAKEQPAFLVSIESPDAIDPNKMKLFSSTAQLGIQSNEYSFDFISDNAVSKVLELESGSETPKTFSGVITIQEGEKTLAYKFTEELGDKAFVSSSTEKSLAYRTLDGAVAEKSDKGLFFNILLAFIGGFILNLMPCVFPVLSIKVMGFVNHAKEGKHKAIQHALVFTLGALLSFWALTGTMLILKSASASSVNWGYQLQDPIVVLVTILVLYVMALNLFGVFEIGVGLTSAGQSVQGKTGFTGSFFSGILATVVATPCMAPMLGAALTYALTQPAHIAMIVFTSVALGMCSPYVFLAAFPKFLSFIPKPGAWMETFKQAMGFLMMLAVVWLMETLQKLLAYPDYFFNILWGFVVIGVGLWVYGKYTPIFQSKSTRVKGLIASIIIVGMGIGYSYTKLTAKPSIKWEAYDMQVIQQKLAEGTPVFIDFTATWCATCQVNKNVAMYPNAALFQKKGVYTVKADFTQKDPKLGEVLSKFDSSGVPLNLLYDGKNPKPIKFPEVYSKSVLEEQLNKLGN